MNKLRSLFFYKHYFEDFFALQNDKVKKKILWTLKILEELPKIPETYLKKIKNSDGIYEVRIQQGNNIYRIFCFFEDQNIVVLGHGFQKKTQKTPKQEIERANQIKKSYYEKR